MKMEETAKPLPSYNSDEDISYKSKKTSRKFSLVLSSDEGESGLKDDGHESKITTEKTPNSSGVDDNIAVEKSTKKERKYRRVRLNGSSCSDSNDSDEIYKNKLIKSKKRIKDEESDPESNFSFPVLSNHDLISGDVADKHIDNDEESDTSEHETVKEPAPKKMNYEEMFKDDIYDAEGSSEEEVKGNASPNLLNDSVDASSVKKKKTKFKDDIYDAEGSSEEEVKENSSPNLLDDSVDASSVKKKKTKSVKSRTASRKAEPVSQIDEIHKEAQRLVRESCISLPYHRPKQRSLADFLNRRKSTPVVPLKSTSEDLRVVWKHLEEREKTAERFYNSDTEESDQENETKSTPSSDVAAKSTPSSDVAAKPLQNEDLPKMSDVGTNSCTQSPESTGGIENTTCTTEKDQETIVNLNIDENAVSICLYEKSNEEVTGKNYEKRGSLKDGQNNEFDKGFVDLSSDVDSRSKYSDSIIKTDGKNEHNVNNHESDENNSVANTSQQYTSDILTKSLFESLDNSIKERVVTDSIDSEPTLGDPLIGKQIKGKPPANSGCLSLFGDIDVLDKVPRFSCGPGDEIDLDQPIAGTNRLMKRFIKHVKLKTTKPKGLNEVKLSVLNVDSSVNGQVMALTEEVLTVSSQETKPGQRLTALKQSLKKSIEVTRSQLLAKRIEQFKLYEQEFYEEVGGGPKHLEEDDEFEKEVFGDNDEMEPSEKGDKSHDESECEDEGESNEEDVPDDEADEPKKKNTFVDEEAEVTEDESEDTSSEIPDDRASDSMSLSLDYRSNVKKVKKSNFDNPDLPWTGSPARKLNLSGLGLDNNFEDDNDLMGLCSGKFQTQPVSLTQLEDDSSQSYAVSISDNEENDFSQEMFSQKSVKMSKIIESDDEGDADSTQNKISIKKKRLQFSDDEADEMDNEPADKEDERDAEVDENDDDSDGSGEEVANEENDEENDINEGLEDNDGSAKVIQYDSEEEIVEGRKFLDVEAELSGSEWGSADEDERGLSDFEADQADDEKINQSKLRSELERIHMQEMMADDKREIKLLQELLLEDGDLHSDGPKRQRLYRWSNQDNAQQLDKIALSDEESGAVDEEEEDNQWRKQRLEREQFLNSTQKEDVEEENSKLPVSDKKWMKQNAPAPKLQDNDMSPDPKHPFKLLTNRGSFLGRGERVLSKLAGLADPADQQQRVKRNMVFTAVSPPKVHHQHEILETDKRKAEDSLPHITKKLKLQNKTVTKTRRSLGLLQKLMESDQTA